MQKRLIFVYNAETNFFSSLTDFAHKIISPSTYACSLCAITHGNFSVKQEWKTFIENLPVKTTFFYKDEFVKQYTIETEFPSVFIEEENKKIMPVISSEEIGRCKTLEQLKELVSLKVLAHLNVRVNP